MTYTLKKSNTSHPDQSSGWGKVAASVSHRTRAPKASYASALWATDHVILNHGQVKWMTPELAPPSPNYHTKPILREPVLLGRLYR
ncbi:hypothetical protein TNCV_4599141 [Trichonephila clavipes]|nr:hypothetical protein TNCV_4599141 [Trichonephila clavipes]